MPEHYALRRRGERVSEIRSRTPASGRYARLSASPIRARARLLCPLARGPDPRECRLVGEHEVERGVRGLELRLEPLQRPEAVVRLEPAAERVQEGVEDPAAVVVRGVARPREGHAGQGDELRSLVLELQA